MRTRETAKNNVLRSLALARIRGYLLVDGASYPTKDGWVPGYVLTHPSVGGESGKRRKRELEQEGWVIQKQKKRDSNAYEYRLFCTQFEASRIVYHYSGSVTPEIIYGDTSHQIGMFQ